MKFVRWAARRFGIRRWPSEHPWAIPQPPKVLWGFNTTINAADFEAACRRFDVRPVHAPCFSFSRRSVGAEVEDSKGLRSWLKVSAVEDGVDDWFREGELEAASVPNLPKPAILRTVYWAAEGYRWRALQMSVVRGRTEVTQWAGGNARSVSDLWISGLVSALAVARGVNTQRWRIRSESLATLIRGQFGDGAPHVADTWHPAHGDLHWGNLTTPELGILDWECWGLAPQGWDAANLVAFSAHDKKLVRRLEHAFADQLATPSGRISRLATLAQILHGFEIKWLDPAYKRPIERMAEDVLRGR